MLDLAIIILTYNTKSVTIYCIKSIIKANLKLKYQIIVVDNASTDGSIDKIKKSFKDVEVIKNDENVGFAAGNNVALRKYFKKAKYCLLLNSDTLVKTGSIEKLIDVAQNYNFGIVSSKLISPDGSFQSNGGALPNLLTNFIWISGLDDIFAPIIHLSSYQERSSSFYRGTKEIGWVSGSVMLIRNKVMNEIGFFDENIFMYGEDVDYCYRAKSAGFKIGWTEELAIVHIGGASTDTPKHTQWIGEFKGIQYFYKKHFNCLSLLILRLQLYIFILLRVIVFSLIGKRDYAKTYAKIIKEI